MSPDKSIILITHTKIVRLRKSRLCSRDARRKIIKTGSAELAKELESKGYEWLQ
jgi:Fe-S cluster assembly ATPase SufC